MEIVSFILVGAWASWIVKDIHSTWGQGRFFCTPEKTAAMQKEEEKRKARNEKRAVRKAERTAYSHVFYQSPEWKSLRWKAHRLFNGKGQTGCMKCRGESGEMHIDHIKPRVKYPELELDLDNLQRLCRACNKEKSYKSETDYRHWA
jgi:5-methylcytosine-specific restriction endonuclease McrA